MTTIKIEIYHRLPFGKHRGQPLDTVPTSYLLWLLRECKLSTGLRAAVAAELQARGITPPAPPAPPPEPRCCRCGNEELRYTWQEDRRGLRLVRRTCARCGTFNGFAPKAPEFIGLADAAASRRPVSTPCLDALLLADALDVEIISDGQQVTIGRGWQRASAELKDALRQRGHLLAQMLGNTERRN